MTVPDMVADLLRMIHNSPKLIIVVGDAMMDVWLHGQRTASNDGCPKLVVEKRESRLGGAANAVRSLMHWGGRVELFCRAASYTTKTRLVEDGTIVMRVDDDSVEPLDYYHRLLLLETVPFARAVLLSDYDKGVLDADLVGWITALCARHAIPCVADCKRAPVFYKGCILKGNQEWCSEHATNWFSTVDVVTMGASRPCVFGENVGDHLPDVECVNHVGAGDCFAAHLALALAYGFTLKDAAALAHSAGRVYVQKPYNEPPHPEDIARDATTPASVKAGVVAG